MLTLDDICSIKGRIGYRGYTKQDLVPKGEGAITLSPSNIQGNKFNINSCTYISWFKYEESPEIMVFDGDILFVKTGSTYGKVALVENLNEKATINPQFVVLKEIKCLNKYLFYVLITEYSQKQVGSIVGGTATPTLSQKNLGRLYIPIPPLSEQKQIVAILDEAFEAIDQAKANIERNIQNAQELFQSKLNQVFSQKGEGWEETEIEAICNKTKNIKWSDFPNSEFEYLDLSGVSRKTLTITETTTINHVNAPSRAKKLIQKNDVLFATTRPTLKRVCIVPSELHNQICSTGYSVLRLKEKHFSSWLFYFLQSPDFMEKMEKIQRGASYPAVTDSDVKSHKVPINDSDIIIKLVRELDDVRVYLNKLTLKYQQKLSNLEELKKSLLQKAFEGELTSKAVEV